MEQKKIFRIPLPSYSLSEELINSISHGVGALFSMAALVICLVTSLQKGNPNAIIASAIYGETLILLYAMSTIYHALRPNRAKRVFRVIDHCSVFLLIAGTYTPYTLVSLNDSTGWLLFGVAWGTAIIGIILNAIDLKKFALFSVLCYLAMGWVILFAAGPLSRAIAPEGFRLMIYGGILYTLGAGLYALGKKIKYMHSIFHFFVLGGSLLHFFSIWLYVL